MVPILADGRVGEPVDRKDFITMGYAHYITTSPDNKFVLANLNGEQATAQYRFDAATGKLTPNEPAARHLPGRLRTRATWTFTPAASSST